MKNTCIQIVGFTALALLPVCAFAQSEASAPDLTGIYEAVPNGAALPKGMKAPTVDLSQIQLKSVAADIAKKRDLKKDPAKNCQPVGPFRMMARPDTKIELLNSPNHVTMLFENIALGHVRDITLTSKHKDKLSPDWLAEDIAHWEGDTLVVDSLGYDDKTWLNDAGAPHSTALHVVERYRPIEGGAYLELKVTAEDPDMLASPFTYTRYYKKTTKEIVENVCEPGE